MAIAPLPQFPNLNRRRPLLLAGAIGLGLLVAVALGYIIVRRIIRRVRQRRQEESMPLIAFPMRGSERPIVVDFPLQPRRDMEAPRPAPAPPAPAPASPAPASHPVQAELVGVPLNGDETIQLLPGRLEVTSGNDRKKEIRFVKGPGAAVVTFGRQAGTDPTHVQVDSPTVSRMHAAMRFDQGRWRIKNLSATNPLLVNGESLQENGNEHMLNDGDQVEMGDVIFRFWSR